MNRLAHQTSPYLLQHADNPVDWWPWCDEAFEEARRRDVPVLLSIGYAACHWCHVMAHESFEDERIAAFMNDHFVNIKVDREERPDVDTIYMEATQAMTGSGGWPLTAFLTPDGAPFYCGTYFPPTPVRQPQGTMPSFPQILEAVDRTWRERRDEVLSAGADIVQALARPVVSSSEPPTPADLATAVRLLHEQFDPTYAGFGGAPKFPPSMVLEFLLRHAARVRDDTGPLALDMAARTLEAMARGGLYDQLGGGFARYSVDRAWVVPHFEKMLYDNALLLRAYLHWHRLTGTAMGERIARETADFLLEELRTPEGGFASSLDADSEGVEGKYYVWTPRELEAFPGAAEVFGVTEEGTFEHGTSTLQLRTDPDDREWFAKVRAGLRARRATRVKPGRDDKVVAAWNGMAIAALAEAGALFDEPAYVDAAVEAAELLSRVHTAPGGDRLVRTSRDGVAGTSAGVLEDYAQVAEAYLMLLSVTGDARWLERARGLLDTILQRFVERSDDGSDHGSDHGSEVVGFFDTADDAETLVKRPQDPTDAATPSGRFAAASALWTYAALTGSSRHRRAVDAALGIVRRLAHAAPRACGSGLAVAEAVAAGPLEIAVVGFADDPARQTLHTLALGSTWPGAVQAVGEPGTSAESVVPLLEGRGTVDGRAAAYVCRGFVCDRPVTHPDELSERIHPWRGGHRG